MNNHHSPFEVIMDELASSSTSGWEVYRSDEHRRAMYALADDYIRYISAC